MRLDLLFSPWRLEYVTSSKSERGCVFCEEPRQEDTDSLVVFHGIRCYVILNRYPYNNGHLMVAPYRHVSALGALAPDELHEIASLTQRSEAVLGEAYGPEGLNVGINLGKTAGAGIVDHLHVHLVPRWLGDTNFMTVVGSARVLPEDLASSARRLRPIFERLGK